MLGTTHPPLCAVVIGLLPSSAHHRDGGSARMPLPPGRSTPTLYSEQGPNLGWQWGPVGPLDHGPDPGHRFEAAAPHRPSPAGGAADTSRHPSARHNQLNVASPTWHSDRVTDAAPGPAGLVYRQLVCRAFRVAQPP